MLHRINGPDETIADVGRFFQWLVTGFLVFLFTSCSLDKDYDGPTPSQLWHMVDYDYRTNDLSTAYKLSLHARNKLEFLSKTRAKELNYPYCLAVLNGRLFLMARSLGDTNSAEQFLLESGFYFNEGRKQSNLAVTNYSSETIEHFIKVYDLKLHPNQTDGVP